jgi:uncharacterized OB-fold protein
MTYDAKPAQAAAAQASDIPQPLPGPDYDSAPYWEAARRHELMLQRNKVTGQYRFPPGPLVSIPGQAEWEWVKVCGRGKVYSFCEPHYPAHPYFRSKVPYIVAIVDLEEGARIAANLPGLREQDVWIGMPVEVYFEDLAPDVSLPQFRKAESDPSLAPSGTQGYGSGQA